MFGREEADEGEAGDGAGGVVMEDVDRAAAGVVEAGLIGEQAEVEGAEVGGGGAEVGGGGVGGAEVGGVEVGGVEVEGVEVGGGGVEIGGGDERASPRGDERARESLRGAGEEVRSKSKTLAVPS